MRVIIPLLFCMGTPHTSNLTGLRSYMDEKVQISKKPISKATPRHQNQMFVVTRNTHSSSAHAHAHAHAHTQTHTPSLLLSPTVYLYCQETAFKHPHAHFYHCPAVPNTVLLRHCASSVDTERCPP